jgi:hypothetical protein
MCSQISISVSRVAGSTSLSIDIITPVFEIYASSTFISVVATFALLYKVDNTSIYAARCRCNSSDISMVGMVQIKSISVEMSVYKMVKQLRQHLSGSYVPFDESA